jgi:hypothetical protein
LPGHLGATVRAWKLKINTADGIIGHKKIIRFKAFANLSQAKK